MSKTWQTKERIIDSLKKKSKTLTDLSGELELAPSTVSQHIHELLKMGRIKESNLSMSKKWKYYEANRVVIEAEEHNQRQGDYNRVLWGAIGMILVIGVLFFALSYKPSGHAGTTSAMQALSPATANIPIKNGTTVFSISDTPMSYNISGVYMNISGISVKSASTGRLYNLPLATDKANLVALDNISQVLANVILPAGAYDMVFLNLSSAYVNVNGKNQSVIIPRKTIALNVAFNISNETTNWVNMDFNLQKSLHVAEGGTIVLLPSVTATYYKNMGLIVTAHELLSVQRAGKKVSARHFDMNLEGIMMQNLTIYENATLNFNVTTGSIIVGSTAPQSLWNRTRSSLIITIGGLVSGAKILPHASGTITTNATVQGPTSAIANTASNVINVVANTISNVAGAVSGTAGGSSASGGSNIASISSSGTASAGTGGTAGGSGSGRISAAGSVGSQVSGITDGWAGINLRELIITLPGR